VRKKKPATLVGMTAKKEKPKSTAKNGCATGLEARLMGGQEFVVAGWGER